ncbi:MAG: MFS transporter [Methanobacteriota archaeon]|nr:MAG: MFS transporter [Euryarchaeota archaeon]
MAIQEKFLLYSSMSFSAALLLQFYQSKAQFFYVVELKMEPTLYGLAIGIWAIYNSINDPLFGWMMDRFPTRWGRRIPWMVLFMIPLCISFALIWTPPNFGSMTYTFLWLVAMLLIFDTGYTIVVLAWAALFPEMFKNLDDRSFVSASRQVFSIVALVVALVLPPFFVKDGDIASYGRFGWILAGISFLNITLALFGCHEPHAKNEDLETYSLKEGIQILLTNRNFQAFLFVNTITYYAYGQLLSMFPFYRKFILDKAEDFEIATYGAALGITVLTLPFWVRITNKGSPKRTFVASSIAFSLTLIPLWFTFPDVIVITIMGLVGLGLAGLLMVVDLLISEVIDDDYLKSGVRREGIFFGFNGFFIRLAILMQAVTFATVSDWSGFDQNLSEQDELGKIGIKIQMLLLPILLLAVSIFVIHRFYHVRSDQASAE